MSDQRRNYFLFLEDIMQAIEKIETYTKDHTVEAFCSNSMAVDAVIRNFEVIGEASKSVPQNIKEKYPHIEWREAAGFRDVLIHDYFGIDIEAVWDTIQNNIPAFKRHIAEVILSERS